MDVNGTTKVTGIFGYPIEHTLSPEMHNSAFRELEMNNCYIPFKVAPEDLPDAVKAIKSLNLLGVNITIPHKEKVLPLLDEVNEEAQFIGAVNTIVNKEGSLIGYNTDGRGFMSSLSENNISADGKEILIVGAGGAARAVSYYLSEKASLLSLFDIHGVKAKNLADDLKMIRDNINLLDTLDDAGKPDIIINATPLGMKSGDPLPLDPSFINSGTTVCDLVYKKTKLLQEADKKGAGNIDGSGMLLWQGVLAFELWTGVKPPVALMRERLFSKIR